MKGLHLIFISARPTAQALVTAEGKNAKGVQTSVAQTMTVDLLHEVIVRNSSQDQHIKLTTTSSAAARLYPDCTACTGRGKKCRDEPDWGASLQPTTAE
jgi:hypothetical protein